MRPALLRLLKRPSALSVLDSLISIPTGIEELESRCKKECLRYYSQSQVQKIDEHGAEFEQLGGHRLRRRSQPRPSSFRVYEIQPPRSEVANSNEFAKLLESTTSSTGLPRDVGLQLEKLEFESDVGHSNDIGTRLVDDPTRRHDFALWEELLRYRQRHYGDKGTLDIWEGLMVRVEGVQLPVRGERADFFWQSFVNLGLKRAVIMNELENYASDLWKKTGNRWDRFYESVVGGFIEQGKPQRAVEWHKKLQHIHLSSPNDILRVLKPALTLCRKPGSRDISSKNRRRISSGLWIFQNICHCTKDHRIYGPVICTLLRNGHYEDVFPMHKFLVARNDHPQTYEDIQPLLEFAKENWPRPLLQKLACYVDEHFPNRIDLMEKDDPTTKDLQTKKGAWLEEKPFKDEFGARLFATKAFNFDMIISGLQMLGVSSIGPQTLREMAVRAHGSQDILDKLRQLQTAGISTGNSVFARLIRKLAAENREVLLSDLLKSDQHFEMLEDVAMQESLLVSYYASRDWRQYNMTLAILTEARKERPDLSNVHFRKFIAADEWRFASNVVDDMALRDRALSKESIEFMVRHVLTPRKQGHMPRHIRGRSLVKEVTFVSQILQRGVKAGTPVSPELWVEILKRLGMINRWHDLRDCSLWLARQYSSIPKNTVGSRTISAPVKRHSELARVDGNRLLEAIFTSQMQAAIVSWGFKMRISRNPEKEYQPFGVDSEVAIPWVRGLVLLRELEQNGVQLQVRDIRQACRQRLKVIFGRSFESSRGMNRMLRRENPYSIDQVIGDIHRAWGEPSLFGGREHDDLHRLVNPPVSKMSLRRTARNGRQRKAAAIRSDMIVYSRSRLNNQEPP
ncbi:hypothetical protein EYZ11_009827 [Aspergillus tanneri]|uniref:Pentatricopeptide repeat domain-containing protein n=1 Tax=Aspergillus tanneri TaxID=1220188 RepID=A0A4S3J6X0_9EURO|nr:uncharacterized protein ATNIH1004_004747 [Aspergillus tanneri]KAA8648861.1 hypothetical protein ATNIH1004_004747 [Aspergillus tanneri]THC90716.1 hypothetical protein EYZ11_009827 [Aspergillus tanneri]